MLRSGQKEVPELPDPGNKFILSLVKVSEACTLILMKEFLTMEFLLGLD